jgi:large subunit ribosomal protein L25
LEIIELKTKIRNTAGNGPARELRRQGRIPAVLYGRGKETVSLSIDGNAFEKILKTRQISHLLLNLIIQNGKESKRTAMIKELQKHPVSQAFLHVDFYEVSMDRKIRVNVPVVTTGKAVGVEHGGVLQVVRRELEVLCLPNQIPASFQVDISHLDIGDAIHVEDIPHTEDVEVPADVNFTVITILSPKKEEEAEEAEEAAEEEEGEAEAAEGEEAAEES